MDYKLHYEKLIGRSKNRILPSNIHTESHHIIPRCMNGSNDESNLVYLTPEEHFLAHQSLVKIFPKVINLICAAHLMCYDSTGKRLDNKSFGWIKRRLAVATSIRFSVINRRPQVRIICPYRNREGGKSTMTRYHFDNCINHLDEDIQQKNKIKRKGKPQSEETKAKRKET